MYPKAIFKETKEGYLTLDTENLTVNEIETYNSIKNTYTSAMIDSSIAHPNESPFFHQQAGMDAARPAIRHMINLDIPARDERREGFTKDITYNKNTRKATRNGEVIFTGNPKEYEKFVEANIEIPSVDKIEELFPQAVDHLRNNPDSIHDFAARFMLSLDEAKAYLEQ